MDSNDVSDVKVPPSRKGPRATLWNILTVLVLLSILCVISAFFMIFMDPNSVINPFPPPTLYPSIVPATITVTPRFTMIPSWTATLNVPQPTKTPQPSHTPVTTAAPLEVTAVPTNTSVPAVFTFEVKEGNPTAGSAADVHPIEGCNWMGVGGSAVNLNGEAVPGIFVQLGGSMPGEEFVNKLTMSGLATQFGPAGYEFSISNQLLATHQTLWVQLLDQQNLPLSDRVYFDTFNDCQQNLITVDFQQMR